MGGEVASMLATSAADLEYAIPVFEHLAQHRENWLAIALRGGVIQTGIGVGHGVPSMTADTRRVVIVGGGARAGALIRAWLGLATRPPLAWQCEGSLATLERTLGRALEPTHAGFRVAGSELARVDRPSDDDVVIELEPLRMRKPGHADQRIEASAITALAPILLALERGPGLRWASLSLLEGRGEAASLGLVEHDASELEQALARALPGLVGRVAPSLARGPQLGTRIELLALLGGSKGDVVDDVLDHLARKHPDELRVHAPHDSAVVLGDPRLWIARVGGVGPLARLVGHLDPDAALARRVWTRVASGA